MSGRTWSDLISRLIQGEDLDRSDTAWAMDEVMSGLTSPVILAGFLTALATKGETVDELRGLADAMLAHATPVAIDGDTLDIVGTGGDRLKTVNISTMSSLVIAAAGVKVVKHGNRASSSSSGSADCLEALGVDLNLPKERVIDNFHELGITFLFANLFHPSMRHAAVARRELAVGTAFNVLGPLTNPARPRSGAIGVSSARHAPIVAGVLAERGNSALIFRGANAMDELSAVSTNQVWEVRDGEISYSEIDAVADLGLAPATVDDLLGDDAAYNAGVARSVLGGESGAVREAVLLNTAGALVAHGRLPGIEPASGSLIERLRRGVDIAAETIDSGRASDLLTRWVGLSRG
ncbi:anthranilate phosphoribosyltransferase [Flaviflexus salsibiostraticola]|uniref:Anthranilate phosphoribosyltransferase n=1 Tax=Flaviflexus salsibiostraticola TaxID=1282737 RepID=A0A3Q8WS82_9ACTO|nr:anthranilate phosphoribosyltransferase [Flaviflexus salsibiostraticola]AZN29077.1 anthranilate phosphoribosyltransferase [Flaviflexus salsibiostraticola]